MTKPSPQPERPTRGRVERSVRAYVRRLGVRLEDEPAAARAVTFAVEVDRADSPAGKASADRRLSAALLDLADVARPVPQPEPAGQPAAGGGEQGGGELPEPVSIVDRLRRPS